MLLLCIFASQSELTMEVNFIQHPWMKELVISALKENCILYINKTSSKDLLMLFIVNEFSKKNNKSSIILTPRSHLHGKFHLLLAGILMLYM